MLNEIGIRAKKAERVLATAGTEIKNRALIAIADALMARSEYILEANKRDVKAARMNGTAESMIDRLSLDMSRIEGMARGAFELSQAVDPVGRVISGTKRPNGLKIEKVTVPLGVIAVIYEARPNVTADAAALCLKSGNTVILRGGKEAIYSNIAIAHTMRNAVESVGLPADCIQLVENTSRESANALMKLNNYVDVLIPRGGAGLIKACVENSTVPVIETGTGNCHTYVDKYADISMARDIVVNAKTSRVSVCNACESVLFHSELSDRDIFAVLKALDDKGVKIHGDSEIKRIFPNALLADDDDWGKEYLNYEISAKVVFDEDEAIEHISKYGTGHSECIVTDNYFAATKFTNEVDAAAVYVNASTRFTDGGEFGFGAEIGISTQKLHARGPLGLENLTSEKYIVTGVGQIR